MDRHSPPRHVNECCLIETFRTRVTTSRWNEVACLVDFMGAATCFYRPEPDPHDVPLTDPQ